MSDFAAARTAMVDCQVRPSDVTKYPIIDALLTVPREEYVPTALREIAYMGEHVALDEDRVLLDARTFAKMLDALNIQPSEVVLDIGAGLGYSTAVISKLCDFVVGLESISDLAQQGSQIFEDNGMGNAILTEGDLTKGAARQGPYDVMILQGAIEVFPDALLDQLKDGGRVCAIFSNEGASHCKIGRKSAGNLYWRNSFDAFAPTVSGFEAKQNFTFA